MTLIPYCDNDQDHEAHDLPLQQAMAQPTRCPGRGPGTAQPEVRSESRNGCEVSQAFAEAVEQEQEAKAEARVAGEQFLAAARRYFGETDQQAEPTPEQARIEVLTAWWLEQAKAEIEVMAPRTVEYGGGDLEVIGRELAALNGRPEVSVEEATEIGIAFFIRGKVGRWFNAIKRGQRPSDDTIDDLCVYGRMAKRNREVGSWPGV